MKLESIIRWFGNLRAVKPGNDERTRINSRLRDDHSVLPRPGGVQRPPGRISEATARKLLIASIANSNR
jgi:hypothetical protein